MKSDNAPRSCFIKQGDGGGTAGGMVVMARPRGLFFFLRGSQETLGSRRGWKRAGLTPMELIFN